MRCFDTQVSRAWHTDVAKFLLEKRANVNAKDNYGRTPLHVASAVDYPEMVQLLIEHGGTYITYQRELWSTCMTF